VSLPSLESTRSKSGALSYSACSARSTTRSMFYLGSTCAYLNGCFSSPALPFQDDASFPAAPRLRIWRLGPWILHA
jgi:hypothetical protein